jgi:formylglycine-generating enzyme required for sulfatase activity
MRTKTIQRRAVMALVALFIAWTALAAGQDPQDDWRQTPPPPTVKPRLAVVDFEVIGGDKQTGRIAAERVLAYIGQTNDYTLVERAHLETALKELNFQTSDLVDDEANAAVFGKQLGVRYLIMGTVAVRDDFFGGALVSARLFDVQTGEIRANASVEAEDGPGLRTKLPDLAAKLIGRDKAAATPTPRPVAPPPSLPVATPQASRTPQRGEIRTLDLGEGVSMNLVWISAGTFVMGSPDNEESRDDNEGPLTRATLSGFWMGETEVTQAQWKALMGKNPSYFKDDNLPVERVSWNSAIEFCDKLSAQVGYRVSLPTETQWEYACRAGATTPFAFGQTISTSQANYNGAQVYGAGSKGANRKKTTPAKSFPPNAWGLYDMHGNVWEWCADWHAGSLPGGSVANPSGPSDGWLRVCRGGSWRDSPRYARSACRSKWGANGRHNGLGFRVAVAPAS